VKLLQKLAKPLGVSGSQKPANFVNDLGHFLSRVNQFPLRHEPLLDSRLELIDLLPKAHDRSLPSSVASKVCIILTEMLRAIKGAWRKFDHPPEWEATNSKWDKGYGTRKWEGEVLAKPKRQRVATGD
jgi:hypothetical protein